MSHQHGRKDVYGRDHDCEIDLPVPNHSGERGIALKSSHNISRRNGDKNMRDVYNFPEPREPPDYSQRQEGGYSRLLPTTSLQREPDQSLGYEASVYNGLPTVAIAPQTAPEMALKHQITQSTPPVLTHSGHEDHVKKEAFGQKVVPLKQIEEYKKKATLLRQELEILKDQRAELRGDGKRSPSPDTKRFLKENTKLQLEIQNKLKTINNVLSMLDGIIGEQNLEINELEEIPDRKRKSRSPLNQKFNYVYYDPEMHWCRVCDVFPLTARDYLNHLHSPVHQKMAAEHSEAPWHSLSGVNEGYPSYPSAPTKRIPIRGLQFFVPATAWYCKLCDQFIGDLHCASAHIKSIVHTKNYTNFVEHNPHWETDWMSDRQRAFEKARSADKHLPDNDNSCSVQYTSHTITISKDFHGQNSAEKPSPKSNDKKKYKKRKKDRNSSQSSEGSESENDKDGARNKKLKSIEDGEIIDGCDSPTPERLCDDDRKLLETLKSRMKRSREERQRSNSREKERIREMQKRIRDSERRGRVSEQRGNSRDRRYSRDRDRRDSRDRRDDRQDWRHDSWDRRPPSRDRRPDSRDRRSDSRDGQRSSRDRLNDRNQQNDGQTELKEQTADTQPALPAVSLPLPTPLPTPLPPPLPLHTPLAAPTSLPPPVIMPPPQPLLPQGQEALSVPKEFQQALEILFPTDPQKCTEMLNAIQQQQQQPSLLGMPPPGLPMFPHLGLMRPPGMFGFDHTLFPSPLLPMMRGAHQNNHRQNRNNRQRERAPQNKPAPKPNPVIEEKKNELDELVMLGIDASDVGAGM